MTQKDRIVHEASELFFQRGVRNVTMNDIAEHLGMSKRTIYEQIQDKDELLSLCIKLFGQKTHNDLLRVVEEENADLIGILRYFVDMAMTMMSNNVGRFFSEVKKYHPIVSKEVAGEHKQERIYHLSEYLREGIKQGLFLPMHNVEVISIMIIDSFAIVEKNEVLEKALTPGSFRKLVVTFFRGIATPKGIERIDEAFDIKHNENND